MARLRILVENSSNWGDAVKGRGKIQPENKAIHAANNISTRDIDEMYYPVTYFQLDYVQYV